MSTDDNTPLKSLFHFKLKLSRVIFTLFAMWPVMFLDGHYLSFPNIVLIGGFSLYFLATLTISFSEAVNTRFCRCTILILDGFALGVIGWLTASSLYAVEAAGMLLISAAITTSFRAVSTAVVFAVIGAATTWYSLPIFDVSLLSNWDSGLQVVACTSLLIVYALTFLHQQSVKVIDSATALKDTESQLLELKFKLYQVSKYMSPTLREKLSKPREIEAGTVRKRLTIFFSDLVGFTKMSESMDPSDLNQVLNGYVTEMSAVAIEYGATIDKFMGDGMMAFFGDPKSNGTKQDAVRCVAMALEMHRRMPKLRAKWREQGIDADLHIRMGINSGFTTVGNFGSNDRLDYTALGPEVNLASRLESHAEIDSIYISSATHILINDRYQCESRGEIIAKGFNDPVPVFTVIAARGDHQKSRSFSNHSMDGFSLYMDLDEAPNYNKKKIHGALVDAANKLKRYEDK